MNTNLTYIAFILDRSGSMQSMAEEAIGGFNAFLSEQQAEEGEANLSLILFDHEYTPITNCTPVAKVKPLNGKTYEPRGMTALFDAMGRTIDDLGKQLADTPEADRPGGVIVVTLTDGMENASKDYTQAQVAAKVKHQQEKYGWQFIFLGANLETTEQAEDLNIAQADRVVYSCVQEGMAINSQEISKRRRAQRTKKIGF
jgi:uncharacterized protein YegL